MLSIALDGFFRAVGRGPEDRDDVRQSRDGAVFWQHFGAATETEAEVAAIALPRVAAGARNSDGKKPSMTHHDPLLHPACSENTRAGSMEHDWRRAHEGLTRLARCRARLDWE